MEPLFPVTDDTRNLVDKYKGLPNEEIKADLAANAFAFHVAIENYQHDFNIGTIVRNANAFNAGGVHVVGERKWNRRGAMVTDRYLELHHHATIEEFVAWAKEAGLSLTGIDNLPGSVDLAQTTIPEKTVLVFGQEGPGLSQEMQAVCEQVIAIEQFGSTRSVNVGVASGIAMYAWLQQHRLK